MFPKFTTHLPTHAMTTMHFCLSIAPPDASMMAGPSVPPAELCLDLRLTQSNAPATPERSPCTKCPSDNPPETVETPATLTRRGSFNYDREHSNFPLEWSNLAAFNAWHREEELRYSIELILPGLGVEELSGPRTSFTSARANCPGAGKSMRKKNQTGIARSAQKKQAAIAAS